jgi:hypothetical protein
MFILFICTALSAGLVGWLIGYNMGVDTGKKKCGKTKSKAQIISEGRDICFE